MIMSLRLKAIIGIALIELILLVILISTILNYMQKINEDSLETYITTTKTLFASSTKDAILSFDLATLENFVAEVLKNESILYVRIFDNNSNVLASGSREQYREKKFVADNSYQEVDDSVYDAEQLITVSDITYAKIQIGVSTERIEQSIKQTRQLAAGIAITEIVLVAFFSFILGIYLTRQLKTLQDAARDISAGNYTKKIDIKTNDEIGKVALAFNQMMSTLNLSNERTLSYQEELKELNKSLEERVDNRTRKTLEQKNKLESAYSQLQKTQMQLVESEKLASIGQLAAGVAHEINNPIGFVKSNLSSLESYINIYRTLIKEQQDFINNVGLENHPYLKEQFSKIEKYQNQEDIDFINNDIKSLIKESITGTVRVAEIVKGLKVFARESNEILELCDLGACLEDALKIINNEIKYKCKIKKDIKNLPLFNCNEVQMTQVFTNLIVNAAQAIKHVGVLTIKASHNTSDKESNITISIADNGEGISEANKAKLFDPFFTTKPVGEGTGLGLSISRGIIADHGGTISVESKEGVGTRFTIVFNL
jgi:two-component system NtrC family sensor kinase